MIVFTEGCDRDHKREEAAASMARPDVAGKKKMEAGASEHGVPLASLFPNQSKTEARPAGAGKKMEETTAEKKMKEAVVSESREDGTLNKEKKDGDSLFKEGEMLRLREELWEADCLWRQKLVPGALASYLKRKRTTQVPAVSAKKKKVVRVILHEAFINCIITNPDLMGELSDEEIAKRPEEYHQKYAIVKLINAKNRAYQQAIIDQYRAFGFAYDEKEVTEDDEKQVTDAEEVAVVKN